MPVTVRGKKIIEKATGKVVGIAKSHKFALISAWYRNRAHEEKLRHKRKSK
jgi:hypothetical protein